MSAGTDKLKQAWRDFITAGIPGSGANEPNKREIREGLDALSIDIAAAAVGDPEPLVAQFTEIDTRLDAIEAKSSPLIVQTYADRASIPEEERFGGMGVYVAQAIDLGGGEYRGLNFRLSHTDLTNAGWRLDDDFARNWVEFLTPPVFDNGVLYFPAFYTLGYENPGYTGLYSPASGSVVASSVSDGNYVRRHVFVKSLYNPGAGHYLEDAIIEVDDNDYPLRDTNDAIVLATTRAGRLLDARDYTVVGDVPGGASANEFRYGKNVDRAPFIFPGPGFADDYPSRAVPADIPDADLIAMGFTRGIKGAPNSPTTYGDYRAEPLKAGDFIAARFKLYAETAGTFGNPVVYIYTSETAVVSLIPTMFRQINSKVREYVYTGRLEVDGVGKWAVGSNNAANASRVWVTGAQFYCESEPAFWIGSNDFPEPVLAEPLLPAEVFLVSSQALPLFAGNGMENRTTPAHVDASASPIPSIPEASLGFVRSARASDAIWLDPLAIDGSDLLLTVTPDAAPHEKIARTIPARVLTVPLSTPRTVKLMNIGDSQSASLMPRYIKTILAAWNIDATFYGTLDTVIGDLSGETREYGEGRGGWGLANYFGASVGGGGNPVQAVLGSGSITAYTGGSYNTRQTTNPFLNNGTSGSAAPVISGSLPLLGGGTASGFRLDMVNYRTRFSLPTDIDLILLNLGQNDIYQFGGTDGLAKNVLYYPLLIAELRRAWPDAQILCWGESPALLNASEIMWKQRRPALAAQLAAVRTLVAAGDDRLHYCGAWMHHTVRSGFPLATGTIDPLTKATITTFADQVHASTNDAEFAAHPQIMQALAAAIANVVEAS